MNAPDFLVHEEKDNVGVIVVEGVKAGRSLSGWLMETDETLTVTAIDDMPLGHKVALRTIDEGETVVKYSHDIGRAVAAIGQGNHVHTHNLKTKRW